jgi:hypothetical protein
MRRALLTIAVLVALACTVSTASAAVGTPASLAANVAAAAVTHHPHHVVRVVTPVYRSRVLVSPVVVPYRAMVPYRAVVYPPVYVGPRYRPIVGGSVYIETPYVSLGIGY